MRGLALVLVLVSGCSSKIGDGDRDGALRDGSGPDAGADAGAADGGSGDAGVDGAGVDAGPDGGFDAGFDGGFDAGPGYTCTHSVRNGSEDCDDEGLTVPPAGTRIALVCVTGEGGVAYVSRNTGPVMSDGVARCQGWEERGDWAGDFLDYVVQMDCTRDEIVMELDLSAFAPGTNLHFGAHTQRDGSGRLTEVCIADLP